MNGCIADPYFRYISTIGHGVDGKIAVLHQRCEALIDGPHIAIELLIGGGTVAVGVEYDKVVLWIGVDELDVVLDLN